MYFRLLDPLVHENDKYRIFIDIKDTKGFIHITSIEASDDYIIILKEERKRNSVKFYRFITAFPVFFKRNKEQYRKDYEKTIKT